MNIPYRTRRVLQRVGVVLLLLLLVGVIAWFCWVIWLERYVVYTREGATLNFELPAQDISGEVAIPPAADSNVSIYYNEGADAVETSKELKQLNGYYIDYDALRTDFAGIEDDLKALPAGTPIMIELKGGYGSFYYSSNLPDAISSKSVDVPSVDELISELKSRGFYTIAKISAFRDYNYGLNHVPSGLYLLSRAGLWADEGGCYWLNPTDSTALGWITSVVLELKGMGFNEVLLADFRFPASDKYIFNDDKDAALLSAANTLLASCTSETFTLSFSVTSAAFPLPEGRCRMYLEGVDAKDVGARISQVIIEDPEIRLVFVAETNDTRFDQYGVMRPLSSSEVLEAQKADRAAATEP